MTSLDEKLINELINFVNIRFKEKYHSPLTDTEEKILEYCLKDPKELEDTENSNIYAKKNNTYPRIAEAIGYATSTVTEIGGGFWNKLTDIVGEKVKKSSFQGALLRSYEEWLEQEPKPLPSPIPIPPDDPSCPGSPLDENSAYYVERFDAEQPSISIEQQCFQEILKPHSLIRIKAPKLMGKTSLMKRILDTAEREIDSRSVRLNFLEVNEEDLKDVDSFLRWFCISVANSLGLELEIDTHWNSILPKNLKCSNYFEQYLLPQINSPLVLGLDEVQRLFPEEQIAKNFFPLLRCWHEKKGNSIWHQLRFVIAYSTEIYIKLGINQSPFNIGYLVEPNDFATEQIIDLASRYSLTLNSEEIDYLMKTVGGHPYLAHQALYSVKVKGMDLPKKLSQAIYPGGIYDNHLQGLLLELKRDSILADTYKEVVNADDWIEIDEMVGHSLYRLGLIKRQQSKVIPSCDLYRQYFRRVS